MRKLVQIAALAAVAVATTTAASGLAEGVTREQYKAAVEPICQRNGEANAHILSGVRAKVKAGKLAAAGRQFLRAATALRGTLAELKAVPRPEADEQRLGEWLAKVATEETLLRKMGRALEASRRGQAEAMSARLIAEARLANAVVVSFGFHYCHLEPSKYS